MQSSTSAPIVSDYEASATDYALALTAGYRFASAGPLTYGVEGNLDFVSGKTMSDSGVDACTGTSPSWCTVDIAMRLRGTLGTDLASGNRLTASLGAIVVRGKTENGPGNYLDTTGRGVSVGVAWERVSDQMPVRIDLNYDSIRTDDQPAYERDLDMVGLRISYMF